jgi:hypothetical protein
MSELKPNIRQDLATLYDRPEYKALKFLLEDERVEIAKKLIIWPADDTIGIAKLQGQAEALKQLHRQLKDIHAQISKEL